MDCCRSNVKYEGLSNEWTGVPFTEIQIAKDK